MFRPIYLLPQFNAKEISKYRDRWNSREGRELHNTILQKIRDGAGEDFLQWDFDQGKLQFLEDMWDLKGIEIFNESIKFPIKDNFGGIDFSYARMYHSKFKKATFVGTVSFSFAILHNLEFVNCIFLHTHFFGTTLEKLKFSNCDFIEGNKITNCDIIDTRFENCFYADRLFFDCKFDELTSFGRPRSKPNYENAKQEIRKEKLTSIYAGIRESYQDGNIITKSREYYYRQKRCKTRYNAKTLREKIIRYFLELLTGYGVKPFRVLMSMLFSFVIFSIFFVIKFGFSDGLMMSAGAFFTFGANVDFLLFSGLFVKLLYIAEAFIGISLTALFIVILSRNWFTDM